MQNAAKATNIKQEWHGNFKAYVVGFILSIILTLMSYFAVVKKFLPGSTLILTIGGLGIIQAVIQLLCFLHIHKEDKPRWNLLIFFFMVTVVLIILLGSIWIMYNLDLRVMPEMMNAEAEGFDS